MSIKIINNEIELNNEIQLILNKFKQKKFINSNLKDLSHLKTYTIDDNDSIEIDDAISLERISDNYKLWIHIASPALHIEYDSNIDKNARKLISTLYLANKNIYMIPEVLIISLLSLSNNEKRISLSLGVTFNNDGSIIKSEIVQSLIKANYQLNYEEADELIDYAPKEEEDLSIISRILGKRKSWRMSIGAKEISESYGKIIVKDNVPIIKVIDQTLSRVLISEAMILYGDLMSDFTLRNKIPVPYRVQDYKDNNLNNSIVKSDNTILNNYQLKKNMGKTYYSSKPLRHNSLGLKSYLHATSPIRRYSDLLVHYQINRFLKNKSLISKGEIEKNIKDINSLGRQNVIRYREDQKTWISKWFENNLYSEYSVIFLNWINKYKNICIIYFVDYKFSSVCYLKTKLEIVIGDNINIKNITIDYNEILHFKLISL